MTRSTRRRKRWKMRRSIKCCAKCATMNSRQHAFHRTIWPYVITNDGVTQIRTTNMGHGKYPIRKQQSSTTSIRKIALNHDIHISLMMQLSFCTTLKPSYDLCIKPSWECTWKSPHWTDFIWSTCFEKYKIISGCASEKVCHCCQ